MSKKKQALNEALQKRTTDEVPQAGNADDVMYGEASFFDDDFLANIEDNSAVYQENESLKATIQELNAQIEQMQNGQLLNQGEVQVGSFTLTPTHLVLPEQYSEDELKQVGQVLFQLEGSLQWLIGDWLLSIEPYTWGKLDDIADYFGRKVKTLYDYKYVARNVQISVRTEILSFQHHALVASLSPDEQAKYLRLAAAGDPDLDDPQRRIPWSVARLRSEIKADTAPKLSAPAQPFNVSPGRVRSLLKIAQEGAADLPEKKRKSHLEDIAALRQLLDEAERRLHDD